MYEKAEDAALLKHRSSKPFVMKNQTIGGGVWGGALFVFIFACLSGHSISPPLQLAESGPWLQFANGAPSKAFTIDEVEADTDPSLLLIGSSFTEDSSSSPLHLSHHHSTKSGVQRQVQAESWSLYGFPFQKQVTAKNNRCLEQRRQKNGQDQLISHGVHQLNHTSSAERRDFYAQENDPDEAEETTTATTTTTTTDTSTPFTKTIWFVIIADTLLCALGALFAGLTLALMGLDTLSLEIIASSGVDPDKTYARNILPLRRKGNQLLSTLVLGTVMVNTLIAQITDSYAKGWVATAISTAIITIAAEIVPQALMSAHALSIGSRSSPVVKFFMFLFYPICKPTAMFLDVVIGSDPGQIYNRNELKRLMMKHATHTKESGVDGTDLDLMVGAIDLKNKTVLDVLTPLSDVYMLEANRRVNEELLQQIAEKGHSRIPIYTGNKNNVIGVLHAKDLLLANPEDNTRIFDIVMFYERKFHTVPSETKLYSMLRYFQTGTSHIALIQEVQQPTVPASLAGVGADAGDAGGDPYYIIKGIVTLEDVMEELLQREIFDEHDIDAGLGGGGGDLGPHSANIPIDPTGNLGMKVISRKNAARTQRRIHLSSNQLTACALFLQRSLPEFKHVESQLLATTIGLFSTVYKIRPPPDASGLAWTDPSNIMLYGPTSLQISSPSSPSYVAGLDTSAFAHCSAVMTLIISGRAEVSPCIKSLKQQQQQQQRTASSSSSAFSGRGGTDNSDPYTYTSASSSTTNAAKAIVDDSVVAELLSWSLINVAGMRGVGAGGVTTSITAASSASSSTASSTTSTIDYYCRVTNETLIMQISHAQYLQIIAGIEKAMKAAVSEHHQHTSPATAH